MSEMPLGKSDVSLEVHHFLQENAAAFREIAHVYVVRMGLAHKGESTTLADEVFQDATLEVLAHPERLMASRQPRAWFMGVMANMVKRRRASAIKREHFEVVISDLRRPSEIESDDDLLDYLVHQYSPGPEEAVETGSQLEEMFALISNADAELLRLALIHELQAEKLGALLKITPATARVRVHRALRRLRLAWMGQRGKRKRGKRDE